MPSASQSLTTSILQTMSTTPIHIRQGTRDDLPRVHQLVCELATYEREPDAVKTTAQDYIRDFDANWFDVLIAETSSQIVGAAIYYSGYSTWKGQMIYLEDLIVTENFRQQGIGTKLFQALVTLAEQRNIRQIKWQVLSWNEQALAFYAKHKANIETGWWNGKIIL